jgi:iron complex outermembrane receptor protein
MPSPARLRAAHPWCALSLALITLALPVHAQEVQAPRLVDETAPVWPGEPADHDEVVSVTLVVDADGSVKSVEVDEPVSPELDAAAIEAAKRWKFEPALRDGKPVVARVLGRVRFIGVLRGVAKRNVSPKPQRTPTEPPPASPPPASTPPTGVAPVEVHVVGRAVAPSRGGSDYTLPVGELARVPRKNASQLLKLAPGVFLTSEGGEGHAERIYLRGFDAREGQDIELSVGGVPINESGNLHGNGFADLHFIIPELVSSLRVLEGPFDPRQGNYAVAGSADYDLGLDRRGLTAKYTRGSYGAERLLLTWGPPSENVHTFGSAEIFKTDGFGQNRDARRASAMGQYEGQLGRAGWWRIGAVAFATEYHSAGLLREDDVDAGRKGFFDTYDFGQGGSGTRFHVTGNVESRSGSTILHQQVFAIHRSMRVRENFTGFLLDSQEAIQSPHGQRGDLIDLDMTETTFGGRGWARLTEKALGHKQSLELGYFARGDDVTGTQQRIEASSGAPYKLETDLRSKLADIGLYADGSFTPLDWLTIRGGVRADLFAFDVLDACAVQDVSRPDESNPPGDASCLSQQRFGRYREPTQRSTTSAIKVMPRASLLLGPADGFLFSVSYGTGVRSIDPGYITQDVATPFASVRAVDAGVEYARSFDAFVLGARSVFFQTHVDRDLAFSETAGRNVLGGGTTRTGWAGSARLSGSLIDQNANVTLVRSAFDDTHLLVPYVPDVVVRSDTAFHHDLPWRLGGESPSASVASGISYIGRRALPYGQRSDTIFTIDASAALEWSGYELELSATNLLDTRYRLAEYNFVSDFGSQASPTLVPARHFVAGAPREVFLSLSATFGGA